MTDVFLSYSREDRPVALWLSDALKREGFEVWWDEDMLPGTEYRDEVQTILVEARCVVVVWSAASVKSAWVRSEAKAGLKPLRLLPVTIGGARIPPPFDEYHTQNLSRWRGDPADRVFRGLVTKARRLLDASKDGVAEDGIPVPAADPGRFTVVVAEIENDIGNQLQDVIAADLSAHEGIHVVRHARPILQDGARPQDAERAGRATAEAYLGEAGGTVMIWGKVLRFGGREVPELHLTVAPGESRPPGRYIPNAELRLPRVFWQDLAQILSMVCVAHDSEFRALEGSYLGDRLRPFVERTRHLIDAIPPQGGWSEREMAVTRILLGEAEMLLGIQVGGRAELEDAIVQFRAALQSLERENATLDWARAQNGLGIACRVLGERVGDAAHLAGAIEACEAAIEARDPTADSLLQAQALNDLGNAHLAVARRSRNRDAWEACVDAYRSALDARKLEESPLDWAQTQANMGVALWHYGEVRADADLLKQAIEHLNTSLQVYVRDRTPLDWAQTQNNLGLAQWSLAKLTKRQEDFVAAAWHLRRALSERRRSMVPLLRAETINNIGLVFWSAGEAVREPRRFRQALRIIGFAEAMVSRDETPIAWANTRNSAGAAHWSLGSETGELEDIRRAVSAFEDARDVYGRLSGGSAQHLRAERNLGNAKISLGLETGDRETIAAGLEHLRAAVDGVCDDLAAYAPAECVELLFDLGLSEIRASKLRGASSERTRAKATLRRAKAAAEKYGMPRHAAAIGRVLDEACIQRRPAKQRVRARRGEASKEARRGGVRP